MCVIARLSSGVTDAVDSVERLNSGKVSTQTVRTQSGGQREIFMPNTHRPLCLFLSARAQ